MPPNQALPRIRGETVIRVTKDFGELIKQAAYTEALKVSFLKTLTSVKIQILYSIKNI